MSYVFSTYVVGGVVVRNRCDVGSTCSGDGRYCRSILGVDEFVCFCGDVFVVGIFGEICDAGTYFGREAVEPKGEEHINGFRRTCSGRR